MTVTVFGSGYMPSISGSEKSLIVSTGELIAKKVTSSKMVVMVVRWT